MALIKCPECGKEVSDNAVSCPGCGFPLKKDSHSGVENVTRNADAGTYVNSAPQKKKRGCLAGCLTAIIVFVVFFVLLLAGSSTKTKNSSVTATLDKAVEETKADLEILSYENLSEGGLRYVTGEIRNNTNKSYSYVQVEINMYKDDTVLGSTLANVNNLGPGETWKFKALITDDDCNRYTIKDVTGF